MSHPNPTQPSPKFTVFSKDGPLRRPVGRISPDERDLALMRMVAIAQYVLGGATLMVSALLIPDADDSDDLAYLILGAVGLALAALRYFRQTKMTLTHARVSNIAGLVFIAAVVAVSRPIGGTPAFFLWPVLTAAYFLRREDVAVILGLFVVTFAVALWGFSDDPSEPQMFVPIVLVVFIVTGLMRLMRESLHVMIGDLQRSASTDDLTGLPNRASFRASCTRELERARRIGAEVSLVLIDLDHFKAVNDRLGHAGGDRALRRCADLIAAASRGGDHPARYGGEEFVIALPDTGITEAMQFAERLRNEISAATLEDEAPLTVSIGVAPLLPEHAGTDALLSDADDALYAAKRGGRNRVERHDPAAQPMPSPTD